MSMETLIGQLALAKFSVERNLEGITEDESRRTPDGGGSSLNWVLGHLVRARNGMLNLLGTDPLHDLATLGAYEQKTKPGAPDALPTSTLMEYFLATQAPVIEGMRSVSESRLAEPAPFSPTGNPDETVGSLLATLTFHEAYHVGQTGVLRRVAGREGAIAAAN